jgi:hypothetical protein
VETLTEENAALEEGVGVHICMVHICDHECTVCFDY